MAIMRMPVRHLGALFGCCLPSVIFLSTLTELVDAVQLRYFIEEEQHLNSTRERDGKNVADTENPPAALFVYVQIDKAGSSTMRSIMDSRAAYHGWPARCQCAGPTCFRHPQPCSDQPDGAIIQGDYGYCSSFVGAKVCRYIVMLRNPVDRIVSAYQYFCLACLDRNKYCGRNFNNSSCPKLSLVEFARRYSNLYTRKFAAHGLPGSLTAGGDYFPNPPGLTDHGFSHKIGEKHYLDALKNLQNKDVLVLALEDPLRMQRLSEFTGDSCGFPQEEVHENSGGDHTFVPSKNEIRELEKLNEYDTRLYKILTEHSALDRKLALYDERLDEGRESDALVQWYWTSKGEKSLRGTPGQSTCETTSASTQCTSAVNHARHFGMQSHPEWYPGSSDGATFEDVRHFLAGQETSACKC